MKIIQKKICLLGDFAVGKTSLIRRFVEGRFEDKYLSTIGVKISRKSMQQAEFTLNLLIWDLAGGDFFTKSTTSYLRGAAGALLVCDLTRPETLTTLTRYITELQTIEPDAKFVILGNKSDLSAERQISDTDLAHVSQITTAPSILTSAKSGNNVEASFILLTKQLNIKS